MKISESVTEDLLTIWPVARLATINTDGSPHQIPIVFAWHDGCFWSPIDGKPKQSVQPRRVNNAIHNPFGSLLLDSYVDDWTQLWWIRADLEIKVILLDEADSKTMGAVNQVIRKLEEKYRQYDDTPVLRSPATLLMLRPTAMTSWCATEEAALNSGGNLPN